MIPEAEQREILANVAFHLFHSGKISQAERIFTGLAASAPEKDGASIGLALCAIVNGEAGEAAEMLAARIERGNSPIVGPLMLYRLVALGMAGSMDEAGRCRDAMRERGMDEELVKADALMAELTKLRIAAK